MRADNRSAKKDHPWGRVTSSLRAHDSIDALNGKDHVLRDRREIDPAICWQAIYSRDRRFDGRFFAGVLTTGVYCRPICPVPLRKPANVRWYRSAASAESGGFPALPSMSSAHFARHAGMAGNVHAGLARI